MGRIIRAFSLLYDMMSEFSVGEEATINYESERSGNIVSRTGEVLQVPNGEKRGFFIQSDENQFTCVMGDQVFSVSFTKDNGTRSLQRKMSLGSVESVE